MNAGAKEEAIKRGDQSRNGDGRGNPGAKDLAVGGRPQRPATFDPAEEDQEGNAVEAK